jgi:hypothetical protein
MASAIRTKNLEYKSFEEVAFHRNGTPNMRYDAIQKSVYALHLRKWLEFFPLNQECRQISDFN